MKRAHPFIENLRFSMRHPVVKAGIVASVVSVAIVVAIGFSYWWPAQRDTERLVEAIQAKRKAVVAAMHAGDVARAYERTRREAAVVEEKLSAVIGQAELVKSLSRLAKKKGVKILAEAYEEGRERGGYVPLYVDLALEGRYSSLRHFLNGIQTLPVWTMVQEAKLARLQKGAGWVKARLRLVTYRKVAAADAVAS